MNQAKRRITSKTGWDKMIAFVNGITAEIEMDHVVVDVGGIGYSVYNSPATADRMPGIGEPVMLHTFMSVKEDGVSLYGFLTKDELKVFKLLITVNGIGPKGGLSILSALGTDDLRFAILSGDARTIAKALRLNEDLVEAIALGHDLGHTPFGHAGERALNRICPYGFMHNEQSVRTVDFLEKDGQGLNLTFEVRDGILNHQTAVPAHFSR